MSPPILNFLGSTDDLAKVLRMAFPFYLTWDDKMILKSCGDSFRKICPLAEPGRHISELFTIRRPAQRISPQLFQEGKDLLFLLAIHGTEFSFRGQVIWFPETNYYLMLGAPWINDPDDVVRVGLSHSDFAVHDQTMDLLQVVQTQRMANQDLQRLTDRLKMQREQMRLREAETKKLALVASRTASAAIITDADGNIDWVNDGFVRLTEWTLEEVRGKKPGPLLQGPETSLQTKEYMRHKISQHEGFQVEILNYTKSGKKYWISTEIQPVFDETGVLTNYMAVGNDITMKVMEDQRRSLRHSVTKILAEGLSLEASSYQVLQVISKHLGASASIFWSCLDEQSCCQSLAYWCSDQDRFLSLEKSLKNHDRLREEMGDEIDWLDQKCFWLHDLDALGKTSLSRQLVLAGLNSLLALPIVQKDGVIGSLLFLWPHSEKPDDLLMQTLNGITFQLGQYLVRKRAEEEIVLAKEMAENASRAKSEFLATISHEIRTPMNGVLGFANLLQKSDLSEQQAEFVDAIVSSGHSLLRVINEVLDLSKIEAGRMELDIQSFSLQACVEEALDVVSSQAADKRIDLAAHVFAEVPESLMGDAQRLKQVMINLLGNAVKFTMEGGVKLEVQAVEPVTDNVTLRFSVSDTGVGIPQDKIDQLFGAYQQGDSSTYRRFGGSGLGLAICKNLVELMGGKISVESQQGIGSTFSFLLTFPVSHEHHYLVDLSQTTGLTGRRVAVMDSHELSRHVIAELLTRWGMDVKTFSHAAELRSYVRDWTPELVLMDGLSASPELISCAQKMVQLNSTVFVMSYPTDLAMTEDRFAGVDCNFITKPIKVSVLYNAMMETRGAVVCARAAERAQVDENLSIAKPLRVLLVEDNLINQKLARTVLSKMGYKADLAVNGQEAVNMTLRNRYDVVFMDIQMPIMDGLEATKWIRQNEHITGSSSTRIIALTANALAGDAEVYLAAGMDDYLSKPLRIEELRKALSRVDQVGENVAAKSADETSATQNAIRELSEQLSPEDAVSLALDFSADLDAQIEAIRSSLQKGAIDEARRNAHSLRGNASIFALEDLQQAARAIEDACANAQHDVAQEAFGRLETVAKSSVVLLKKVIMDEGSADILERMS
jgi:PAS domain S-box-containing protein